MTTLADAVNATAILLNVDGSVPAHVRAGFEFQLDDELLRVVSFGRYQPDGRDREPLDDRGAWYVDRGLHGTTAAAHDAGTVVKAIVGALVASEDVALPDPLASGGTTLSADIVAALEGAASPSGKNPFVTASVGNLYNVLLRGGDAAGLGITNLGGLSLDVSFPTADPHVAGRVWSNSGVLTVSAG